MTQRFAIHPRNPQRRLVRQAVALLGAGGLIAYPTDSCYALGCAVGAKEPMERAKRLRGLAPGHPFTLVCRDLSELSAYARVDNLAYRTLRAHTPGPYTFLLPATREVPRRLMEPRRRTIGLRIPDHEVVRALLAAHGAPLMSCTLMLPELDAPPVVADEIHDRLRGRVELVIDSGICPAEPTTVVALTAAEPEVVRQGRGAFPLAG